MTMNIVHLYESYQTSRDSVPDQVLSAILEKSESDASHVGGGEYVAAKNGAISSIVDEAKTAVKNISSLNSRFRTIVSPFSG